MNNLNIYGVSKTSLLKSLFDILTKLSNLVNVNLKEEDVGKLSRS